MLRNTILFPRNNNINKEIIINIQSADQLSLQYCSMCALYMVSNNNIRIYKNPSGSTNLIF